ncbi:hypothetical protein GPECTOR_24g247 [Gonium pectorale]|uniref:Uncharacterized protein n=1 Tax=Gonium pectorale TaxID=33097 RepID=A0A150GGI6_GONPE|nr:hypothetical protein GPECTOR_24g247 [Gonium pectorale]|eukprot:KXZ48957.1 hypothetical protein GPECTOR_24g247 [Gonium pectorale]
MGASALSTPTISTGSLSLGPNVLNTAAVEQAASSLHNGSPMTPRQMLATADNMLLMPSSSLINVHSPSPGQGQPGQGQPPPPPPPPPSTPNHMMGMGGAGNGLGPSPGGSGGHGGASSQGQLTMAFANALAQAAAERGVDPGTLVQLLQSPKLVDVLLSKAGDLQQQQQQPQQQMQQVLSSHLVQEFVSARGVLVQLMLSAFAFLNSDSMRDFYAKLARVAMLYDEMHDLPVVQKRKRCMEMSYLRNELMHDPGFTQILQAVCALRHHLHSLSRKVLVMNQGPDGIPIDLLLGSMSTELFHVMKTVLPQEVCDFFGNCLPHPRLAVLVFAEFTSVDPMPTLT